MATAALHVEVAGAGPALVLAHGFGGSARNWRPQVRALREEWCVVTCDLRGHARSPAPAEPAAYRLEAMAADLAEVARGTDTPPPVIGGLSLGAALALHVALAGTLELRGLVLASPPAGPEGPESGRGPSGRALAFADTIEAEGLERAGARFVWGPESGLDPAGARLVRQGFLEHAPHALAHLLRELLARLPSVRELEPQLAQLQLPVLVVAGAADPASRSVARALAGALPGGQLVEIPGAGHVVNLAAPEAFNRALRRFLRSLG